MDKIIIEKEEEVILLAKLISYVKFTSTDDEGTFLAKSPILNRLSDKVRESIKDIPRNITNSKLEESPYIKENIIKKLTNVENWLELDENAKYSIINTLVYPYSAGENTLEEIYTEIDKWHRSN